MTLFGLRLLYPWALFYPLAFLLAWALFRSKSDRPLVSSLTSVRGAPKSMRQLIRAPLLFLLFVGFILFSSVAASRPQLVSRFEGGKRRNLILCLDVSKSMETPDFIDSGRRVTRLQGVQRVVNEFIDNRPNDRIGLIIFGGQAFLQAPLTRDHDLVKQFVSALTPGMAGDGTAIGDGLGLSLKRIQDIEGDSKAIILLTDGVNNAGQVEPIKAAKIAGDLKIKIHTIGVGSKESSQFDPFSGGGIFSMHIQGEFDEETLKAIAKSTDGVFFNAGSTKSLRQVYEEIDRLDEVELQEAKEEIVDERFPEYAGGALLFYTLFLFFSRTVFLKVP